MTFAMTAFVIIDNCLFNTSAPVGFSERHSLLSRLSSSQVTTQLLTKLKEAAATDLLRA